MENCERQFTEKIGVQSFLELFSILKDGEFWILKDSLQRRMVLSFADKNKKDGEFWKSSQRRMEFSHFWVYFLGSD